MIQIMNIVFLVSTIISSLGLIYIIYSRKAFGISRKLYILALFLVIGYLISHAVHFILMTSGDVTILDQSCHSFLLLIILVLCFFSYYYPNEKEMSFGLRVTLVLPSVILIIMLWSGNLIEESHVHHSHFEAHYKEYYAGYLIWYVFLLMASIYFLIKKIFDDKLIEYRSLLLTIFIGLIITNSTVFIFGLYLPWILGFYYLVEISPLAFFIGVILTTTIAITKYNLFPVVITKIQSFSLTKKVFFTAIIVVPVIILLIQIPLGRLILNIQTAHEWQRYFFSSLAGGILVSSAMAFIISRIIANPLNKLTEKTSEIKEGNYGIKVDINSNDEIGKLAETFNEMSDTLKKDTRELKEKQEKIELLLNAFEKSNAAICAFDEYGAILEINSQFAKLLRSGKQNLLDQNIFKEVEEKTELEELALSLKNYFEQGIYKEEIVIETDKPYTYLINISPFTILKENVAGYFLIVVDITEIKKLENELAHNEKLAALGKMAAVLAHEIKTPLTSIKMNSDMLAESLPLNDEDKYSMQIINREINRLNNLVKEVLQFAQQVELNKEMFNIKELLNEIIFQTKQKYAQKNFEVLIKCEDRVIKGDKEKLRQVFLNIIDNAYEASDDKGFIVIEGQTVRDKIELLFNNNGVGVSQDVADKIFDPFYTTKPSGTGLGLAVAQKIVTQHNGNITLESSEPGETIFKVVLDIN